MCDEDARNLVFEKLPREGYKVISGKTIWYNIRRRLKTEGMKELFEALRGCTRKLSEKLGIKLGKVLLIDGFPVRTVKSDNTAEFSGYYSIKGYKCVYN